MEWCNRWDGDDRIEDDTALVGRVLNIEFLSHVWRGRQKVEFKRIC